MDVYVVEFQNVFVAKKTCWSVLSLLADSGGDFRNEDMTGGTKEIYLQGLNLSSAQVAVFNPDLALLQPVMNAMGTLDL